MLSLDFSNMTLKVPSSPDCTFLLENILNDLSIDRSSSLSLFLYFDPRNSHLGPLKAYIQQERQSNRQYLILKCVSNNSLTLLYLAKKIFKVRRLILSSY